MAGSDSARSRRDVRTLGRFQSTVGLIAKRHGCAKHDLGGGK